MSFNDHSQGPNHGLRIPVFFCPRITVSRFHFLPPNHGLPVPVFILYAREALIE